MPSWTRSSKVRLLQVYRRATLIYRPDLFDEWRIERLADQFLRVLAATTRDPERPIGEVSLLAEDEQSLILNAWARG